MKPVHQFAPIVKNNPNNFLQYDSDAALNVRKLDTQHDLLNILATELSTNILIDGGHYPLEQHNYQIVHKPNPLTLFVFDLAVKLFIKAREMNLNPCLSFFYNDMGLDEECRCFLKEKAILHPDYELILKNNGTSLNAISVFFYESNLRNRAGRLILKKGVKSNLIATQGQLLYVPSMSDSETAPSFANQVGLKSEHSHARYMIPFCRAIMAQKLKDSEKKGREKIINIITEQEFKCLGEFVRLYHLIGGDCRLVNVLASYLELGNKEKTKYNNGLYTSRATAYYLSDENNCFIQIQKYDNNTFKS